MRTSQANARFTPAPTAAPLTAATVGSTDRCTRRKPSYTERSPPPSEPWPAWPRWERSAPAQKAGGAPVTTTAPTDPSASNESNADTISSTMSSDRALRRLGSSSVTSATPLSTSVRTRVRALLVADDGGRVLEEVLDLAFVPVRRAAVADGLSETAGAGEALDGARRRVPVLETRPLETAVVD